MSDDYTNALARFLQSEKNAFQEPQRMLWPFRRDPYTGDMGLGHSMVTESLVNGLQFPAKAMSGKVPMFSEYEDGKVHWSPEWMQGANDTAGLAMTGAVGIPKPQNALGSGGGGKINVFDPSDIRSVNAAFDPAKSSSANLLASNPREGAAAAQASNVAERQATQGIKAYHGSPHDFDQFDLSKIGTGEGAQAYGHGLYFAESEGVAKSYREKLSKLDTNSPQVRAVQRLEMSNGNVDDAIAVLLDNAAYRDSMEAKLGVKQGGDIEREAARLLQSGADLSGVSTTPGRMYEVRINADPEDFLDWDKPLSQQSEKVRGALGWRGDEVAAAEADRIAKQLDSLNKIIDSGGLKADAAIKEKNALLNEYDKVDPNASAWWKADAGDHAARPEAAKRLREAGIPGIRYLDQGSRSSGNGTSNYVVFDDKIVEILRKYGLLPPAVGAAALAGQTPQSDY